MVGLKARNCGPKNPTVRANSEGLKEFVRRFQPVPACAILTHALRLVLTEGEEVLRPTCAAFLLKMIREVPGFDQISTVETTRKELIEFLEADAMLATWAKVIHELANMINLSSIYKERSKKAMEDLRSRIETVLKVDNDQVSIEFMVAQRDNWTAGSDIGINGG